jgi:hypothetical protein
MMHAGGCHCGNLRYTLETALALDALPLRACQCAFCKLHGARSTSDPAGRIRFEARSDADVVRYRFGLKLADFLVCAHCGIYVGATMREDGRAYGIVNANTFDEVARLTQAAAKMDYDGEDPARRQARRASRWSPALGP